MQVRGERTVLCVLMQHVWQLYSTSLFYWPVQLPVIEVLMFNSLHNCVAFLSSDHNQSFTLYQRAFKIALQTRQTLNIQVTSRSADSNHTKEMSLHILIILKPYH